MRECVFHSNPNVDAYCLGRTHAGNPTRDLEGAASRRYQPAFEDLVAVALHCFQSQRIARLGTDQVVEQMSLHVGPTLSRGFSGVLASFSTHRTAVHGSCVDSGRRALAMRVTRSRASTSDRNDGGI